MTEGKALKIRPATPHIGADVLDFDLAAAIDCNDPAAMQVLQRALDRHIVLRFKGQSLAPAQIERFGRAFGPLLSLKRTENSEAEHLEGVECLKIISNVQTADGKPLGDGSAAPQDWHTDGAMKPRPASYSHFYARKVPPSPPKTYWMNVRLVYEALPDYVKRELRGLEVIHHHYSAGNEFPLPPSLPLEERLIGPRHPLVRVHPSTGHPLLYLPHRDDALIVGMREEESATLMASLRDFAARTSFWWGVALEVDDFVVWDNRACLHRRDGWDPSLERVMWHLATEGEEPIPFVGGAPA